MMMIDRRDDLIGHESYRNILKIFIIAFVIYGKKNRTELTATRLDDWLRERRRMISNRHIDRSRLFLSFCRPSRRLDYDLEFCYSCFFGHEFLINSYKKYSSSSHNLSIKFRYKNKFSLVWLRKIIIKITFFRSVTNQRPAKWCVVIVAVRNVVIVVVKFQAIESDRFNLTIYIHITCTEISYYFIIQSFIRLN